jgi:hypothetical protein
MKFAWLSVLFAMSRILSGSADGRVNTLKRPAHANRCWVSFTYFRGWALALHEEILEA